MGKKRAAAVSATAVPLPGPAAAEPEPDHFNDYGFDPQLLHFFSQLEVKRLWGRRQRHHQHQPAQSKPLESARFKLQKPISKKHHHRPQKQQRRRWWSSAASAALHLFKKRPSSTRPAPAAAPTPPYGSAASTTVPLYLADYDAAGGDDDDGAAACTCWAPAVRSGSRLAAAELGAAAVAVPYVSLRSTSLAGGGGAEGAPVMPIYLVT
ncbi:unnamed protein product [Miscanthus lutarioriparius]|uniref:Uncharacterized protein n=1 Tax=Miscanthus lutarioriparius TaxID=422564 RepID=A0A811RRT7_9POAL|nr:unnamed protein product [Miscanthus lutarioriparius]